MALNTTVEAGLAKFGFAVPTDLDGAERLLMKLEQLLERRPDDSRLERLVSLLRDRVDDLAQADLVAQFHRVH